MRTRFARKCAVLAGIGLSGCFASSSGDGGDDFEPPADASVPTCAVEPAPAPVCEGAPSCPVIDSYRATCGAMVQGLDIAPAADGSGGSLLLSMTYGGGYDQALHLVRYGAAEVTELMAGAAPSQTRLAIPGDGVPIVIGRNDQSQLAVVDGEVIAEPVSGVIDVTSAPDGRIHVLYEVGGTLSVAERSGGSWSIVPMNQEGGWGVLAYRDGEPFVVYSQSDFGTVVRYQALGGEPVELGSTFDPGGVSATFVAGDAAAAPVTVIEHLEYSHGHALGGTLWTPGPDGVHRTEFSGLETTCAFNCGGGCSGTCVESGERISGGLHAAATAADGRIWVAYIARQVERTVQLDEDDDLIFGCSCNHRELNDAGSVESLVLATVTLPTSPGGLPVVQERFRGPLPDFRGYFYLDAEIVGNQLHVALGGPSIAALAFAIDTTAMP